MSDYNGSSIQVLDDLEHVRKRPGMYIGSTNVKGLHHLIWEILDNAVDEHLEGYCTEIILSLNKDGSATVEDNGRGIPVDLNPKLGICAERVVYTVLNAGGKFDNNSYKVHGGLHGVGASVTNALSSWLEVEVYRDGNVYRDRYENGGKPVVELQDGLIIPSGKTKKRGTKVTFYPDASIFETVEFKPDVVKKRIREFCYLNKGLVIHFKNEVTGEEATFHEEDGIVGFVRDINKAKENLSDDIVYVSGKSGDIEVEVAFQYTREFTESILSFCNNISTVEGGTHVTGFKNALTRVINQYAKEIGAVKEKDGNFDGRDVRSGITAVISLKHPDPQFEGQTKTKLGNSDAMSAVYEVLNVESQKYFDRNIETLKLIIDNAMRSLKLRKAEEKVKTNLMNNGKFSGNGKLASSISKDPEECEIFLVEGDSAGGSAKNGRNRQFQAILPLKGKGINVEKADISKVIANGEISSLVSALGCGFGEGYGDDFDIKKLKYSKIIILTDADVDGSHIRTLLLTLFHRFMPELIYEGKIYIGVPPLYKVVNKKDVHYCYSDRELNKLKEKLVGKIDIQRYKGLGEMDANQLWETTLNPETRLLKRVSIDDAVNADEITNILMGSKVEPRREFIYENALNAVVDL